MLIPDIINKDASTGEKLLFNKFKYNADFNNLYILHSVFTYHHLRNLSGEIDFLILYPNHGILAIEVKHGKVERKQGKWIYTNKLGVSNATSKSPFVQVDSSMHSIRNYILSAVRNDVKLFKKIKSILFGTGVAFTSMKSKINFGQESYGWQILDAEELRSSSPIHYLRNLAKEWHKIYLTKTWYDNQNSKPTLKDCELILSILRGNFKIDYNEINRISDNNRLITRFTKEQFKLLDIVLCNDRNLIKGLASVGKTSIAIEFIRRHLNTSIKIGFFCFNNLLGEKLKSVIKKLTLSSECEITVNYYHSYLANNCESQFTNKPDYFSETLPFDFIIDNDNMNLEDKFDVLIIDEVQDLLTPHNIEVFDLILKNGISNGRWLFLGDFEHQSIYVKNGTSNLQDLERVASFTNYELKVNCRNPKPIAIQNTLTTGIEYQIMERTLSDGIKPEIKFPSKSKQLIVVEESIKSILDKKISLDKIALLSPKVFERTFAEKSKYINELKSKGLLTTTIHSFKGLESSFIILYDFDELLSQRMRELLYIGISRATHHLILIFNQELESEYNTLIQSNILKINSDGN